MDTGYDRIAAQPIVQKSIWIKEQKGTLTMGSLENGDHTVAMANRDDGMEIYNPEILAVFQ